MIDNINDKSLKITTHNNNEKNINPNLNLNLS